MQSDEQRGILTGAFEWLFGARVKRLREQASRTHWLSYLLIISQSIAVILVFGHAEVGLLLTHNLAEMVGAALALFVLTITVIAADIALLDTLTRVAPLARNRQSVMLSEHILYVLFVMAVEGSTYGIVLYTLDSNPQALVRSAPLIPTAGLAFLALVLMRVMLICWSAVQLIIVRGKLPVLLSTLMNVGKEIVGAHVERQLTELDLNGIPVRDTFGVYADMAQAPRPTKGLFNGWLVDRALAREAEEARQAANISASLARLDSHRAAVVTLPAPSMPTPPDGTGGGNGGGSASRLNNATKRAALERDMLTARSSMYDPDEQDIGGWSARNGEAEDFDMAWEEARPAHPTHPRNRSRSGSNAATIAPSPRMSQIVVDLPDGKTARKGDTPEARKVMNYLDRHHGATIADVMAGARVSRSTARRYYTAWIERNKRADVEVAPFTEEMPAISASMLDEAGDETLDEEVTDAALPAILHAQ